MRSAGGYTIHQSLSAEAASIVKQAVSLARRRGHAQVTPLHVASAMLASSTGLLRRACIQAHSHPLQCKALELCFNVALNRLPTSTSNPILGHHSHLPSLSNALVAAFKRAQAHQRRGSIENQQQPILALKVEIEQLIISILDDPSVSRVMREAGFSSTQVKNNVEQAISLEVSTHESKESKPSSLLLGNSVSQITPINNQFKLSLNNKTADHHHQVQNDDVMSVVDAMMNKKRKNIVIIAEYAATAEGILRGVIDKFDKGQVPGDMEYVQFISVPLYTLRNISREEFEKKLGELRSLVKSYINRGVVLYLGDLQWVSEFWSKSSELRNNHHHYSPVEHMIMELSRLCGVGDQSGKLWLMGISTFKTFPKCKNGHPNSLETLWDLHPLLVPVGSLALSLNFDTDLHTSKALPGDVSSWLLGKYGVEKHLTCCRDCLANFKREAPSIATGKFNNECSTGSSLPSWLQKYREEHTSQTSNHHIQWCDKLENLCKKWNSICSSVHKRQHFLEKAFIFSSSSPPNSSTSISSNELHKSLLKFPQLISESTKSVKEHQFLICEKEDEVFESKLTTYMQAAKKPDLLSNPNSSPNSASSSEASGDMGFLNRFNELNPENQKTLCSALEKKVPWQREIIPGIVSTILKCRSGVIMRRKQQKEETWLFFLGFDSEGKEKIGMELARVIFGSEDSCCYVSIGLSSFSSTRDYDSSTDEVSNKRSRDEHGKSYLDRFADAVRENPSRVFFMEDVDQVEYRSQMGIKKAIESGSFTLADGELVSLKDAIVIFSCDSFSSFSRSASSPPNGDNLEEIMKQPCTSLDLNISIETGILDLVDKQIMFKIQVL